MRGSARSRDLAILVSTMLASRLVYLSLGVHFDVSPLSFFLQYADPALLRSDLPRTLLHFHVDPPLMDAIIGLALRAFGTHYGSAMHLLFILAGVALSVALYTLMRDLGVGARVSLVVSSIFAISPATVLFENLLYPDYLVAASLLLAAVALHRFARTGRILPGAACFSLLAGVVLSRSLFHLAWLLLVLVVVAWLLPQWRRRALVVSLLPILVCGALYGKNLVLFDNFGAATCLGLNLSRVTTAQLPAADRSALINSGRISVLADQDFYGLPTSRPDLFASVPRSGIPVRDQVFKSTGSFNYNMDAYLPICRQYQADAVYVAIHRPSALLRSWRESLLIFFLPGSDYFVGLGKPSPMTPVARIFDSITYGQVQMPLQTAYGPATLPSQYTLAHLGERLAEVGWFKVAAWLLAVVGGVALFRRIRAADRTSATAATLAFGLLTAGYVLIVGTTVEVGENNRFSYVVDGLVLAIAVAVAVDLLRRRRTARNADPGAAG